MIPLSEFMKDRWYSEWLNREPVIPEYSTNKAMNMSPPWVVYVQREANGKWGKREFWKYAKALKFLNKALKLGVHDAALNNKRNWSAPPFKVVRVRGKYMMVKGVKTQVTKRVDWTPSLADDAEGHEWCGFCRRPTLFKYYAKHKRLVMIDPTVRRCNICGASERIALVPGKRRVH